MRTLVVALALVLPPPASLPVAEDDRKGDSYWHERCASEDDTHRAACLNYLDGLTDGLVLGMGSASSAARRASTAYQWTSLWLNCGRL